MLIVLSGILVGVFLVVYIPLVVVPIIREARYLMALRRRSLHLTALIDQGKIQVGSLDYWTAIAAMTLPRSATSWRRRRS